MRAFILAALFAAVLAPAASAATRPIQATDAGGRSYWFKNAVAAQQGDTIEWRLRQPGNDAAASHDVWIIPPGGVDAAAKQLAQAGRDDGATAVVDRPGVYRFYCSVHDGLSPNGMNGTITVTADDPGPVEDPGQPWVTPDTSAAPGPAAAFNTSVAPPAFELGDTTPPTVRVLSVSGRRRGARVRVRATESGSVIVRLLLGSKVVASRRAAVKARRASFVSIKAAARVHLRTRRARVQVVATDAAELESAPASTWVWIGD
jgi:plastocyanin